MKEVRVSTINEFNERLVGIKTFPSVERERYPTVILVHGFGVTKEEYGLFDGLAKSLASEGFLVYRFDFSGCGESEGNYSETSLGKLKSDLSKIIDFVNSAPEVDNSRMGMFGQSFGTSVIVASEPNVKCLVMAGSIAHPKEVLGKLFGNGYSPNGISRRLKSNGRIIEIEPNFWKSLGELNLVESIRKIHCPILFINGSKDDKVPISEMEDYFENANFPKRKLILSGLGHNLNPYSETTYNIVSNWFKKYLT